MRLSSRTTVVIAVVVAAAWIVVAASVVDRWTLADTERILVDVAVDSVFLLITAVVVFAIVTRAQRSEAGAIAAAEEAALAAQAVSHRLRGLHALDLGLRDATAIEPIMAAGARHLRAILGLDRVTVGVFDRSAASMTMLTVDGEDTAAPSAGSTTPTGTTIDIADILEEELATATGFHAWEDLRDAVEAFPGARDLVSAGLSSGALAPIVDDGRSIGFICAMSKAPRRFSKMDIDTMDEVAGRLRLAILQARDRDELEHRRARLDVMHALDLAILEATDPADFAVITARFLGELVPCDRISVGLWDGRREELTVVGSWIGTPPASASAAEQTVAVLPYSDELQAFADLFVGGTARIVPIEDLPGTSLTLRARAAGVRVYYLVPLLSDGGELIATIGLGSRELDWFTPDRRAVTDEVASQLAVGLRQAVLRRQLAASERLFSDVFALTPTPVTLTRISDRRILAFNDAASREIGVPRAEVVGKTADRYVEWVVPADRAAYVDILTRTGECHGFETSLRLPDGRIVRELLSARLVEIEGESCILTAALDITERVAMEARLHQSRKMEVMGQFASILAHDLRNYLNAVSWAAELLASEIDAADPRRRDVDHIRLAADDGLGMIRNVLGFARPEGGGAGTTDMRAHLGQIGGIVARLVGPEVAVEFDIQDDLPAVAMNSASVTQIVFNLAANARDAMPDGGRFRIGAESMELTGAEPSAAADPVVPGRFVRLTVVDSGEGMDPQTASRAFEAFYTTRDATGGVAGTGLGLSSVYLIVTRAGGRIDLQSDPGVGTTFTIDLPAAAA